MIPGAAGTGRLGAESGGLIRKDNPLHTQSADTTPSTTETPAEAVTVRMSIGAQVDPVAMFGPADAGLRRLEALAGDTRFHVRGHDVTVTGSQANVDAAVRVLGEMRKLAAAGQPNDPETVERLWGEPAAGADVLGANILSHRGTSIRPKTFGQHQYVNAIRNHTITFGTGPAGTGKTYLAMAMAVTALQHREVARIILTRPAVEAGEHLGFLPGSLDEKIDPYVRPLYDALHDMIDPDHIKTLLDTGVIEVAPLAYMRGRTLNDAFIILDEAQNTTFEQMKMFLTRLGFNSTMVITGDTSQVDLPGGTRSGLRAAGDILSGVDDIAFMELTSKDVVRHRLVTAIVDAYDHWTLAHTPGENHPRNKGRRSR